MQAAIHLAPIIAAEKSKTAFYIAGGALVLWALVVSLGIGLRRPDFPNNLGGERAVIAITVVLVLAAVVTAVATSGTPATGSARASTAGQTQPTPSISAAPNPAPSGSAASTGTAAGTTPAPASTSSATTTTPAPATTPAAATKPAAAPKASALALAASPGGQLSFNTKRLSAPAGRVTINFANASPLEHNLTIAQGSTVLGATPTFVGGSRKLTLTLKPGTYTFYCSVPGHRFAGMEGTLKVS